MIEFNNTTKEFALHTNNSSYIFCITAEGYLKQLHYGLKVWDSLGYLNTQTPRNFSVAIAGTVGNDNSLDSLLNEFPVSGSGDFRLPAMHVATSDGVRQHNLKYSCHKIVNAKPPLAGMPSLRGGQTLIVTLISAYIKADLFYTVYPQQDAITRRVEITLLSGNSATLSRLASISLDLPSKNYQLLTLYGAHASERNIERLPLRHGVQSISSSRGAASHQLNPFMCLVSPTTTEFSGDAYGFHYVYGGNFLMSAEVNQYDTTRIYVGFNDFDFEYTLTPNNTFCSPEAVMTFSANGLSFLSQNLHDLYRLHIINKAFVTSSRPIVLNNWEATYFDFNQAALMQIIDNCAGLAIDTFVLDDGWFGIRNDDCSGLGDWYVNTQKLKGGLTPIIEHCKKRGLKFGLWFEPEMVSPNSLLYRSHPEYCISVTGITPALGRNQLVLDLSQKEVVEYIQNAVCNILQNHDISYVKWDFNRHITDTCRPSLCHDYMLGFYQLLDNITKRFPHILFEGCSGGGGRFDPSMLKYFPQSWASDCTDAYERTKIQYGTSLCYPLSSTTCHVSVCPNHQTGRNTELKTRIDIASLGGFGYELNPNIFTQQQRDAVLKANLAYRSDESLVLNSDLFRLVAPHDDGDFCFLLVSKDKCTAKLTYFSALVKPNAPLKYIKFKGLEHSNKYLIKQLNLTLTGQTLMSVGLPLPMAEYDFFTTVFTLKQVR